MDRLVAGNCAPGAPKRTEMLAGADPALDRPMILFQYIVEILHRSMSTVLLQSALGFELYDGWRVSGVLEAIENMHLHRLSGAIINGRPDGYGRHPFFPPRRLLLGTREASKNNGDGHGGSIV